jgi:hypothetical protein
MVSSPRVVPSEEKDKTGSKYIKSEDSVNPFNLSNDRVKKLKEFKTVGIKE